MQPHHQDWLPAALEQRQQEIRVYKTGEGAADRLCPSLLHLSNIVTGANKYVSRATKSYICGAFSNHVSQKNHH
jgi:hypothetical protein